MLCVRPALGPGAGRHLALCSQWGGRDSGHSEDTEAVVGWLSEPHGPLSPTRRGARPDGTDRARRHTAAFAVGVGTRPVGQQRTCWKPLLTCRRPCGQPVRNTENAGLSRAGDPGWRAVQRPKCHREGEHLQTRVPEGYCQDPSLQVGAQGTGRPRGRGLGTGRAEASIHAVCVCRDPLTQNLSLGGPSAGIKLLVHTRRRRQYLPGPRRARSPRKGVSPGTLLPRRRASHSDTEVRSAGLFQEFISSRHKRTHRQVSSLRAWEATSAALMNSVTRKRWQPPHCARNRLVRLRSQRGRSSRRCREPGRPSSHATTGYFCPGSFRVCAR